ncbi:MAG TPA: hypothetical protein ENJ56_01650 [Anaerolineae bacterium]|nr:hypothetical protein [Anaerolineae bacterium]
MRTKKLVLLIVTLATVAVAFVGLVSAEPFPKQSVPTSDFIVNSTGDAPDNNIFDGNCDTGNLTTTFEPECTLRAAIEQLNQSSQGTHHTVTFAIAGAGPHTIAPATAFNTINRPTLIDGLSQAGSSCPSAENPGVFKIVLAGSAISVGNFAGLSLAAGSDGSTIQGLIIGDFGKQTTNILGSAISISASDTHTIRCNQIGLAADGVTVMENLFGISITNAMSNTIGGSQTADRNIIANSSIGVQLNNNAVNNHFYNNYIGTSADGTTAAPNSTGFNIIGSSHDNIIGIPGQGNLIAFNAVNAIQLIGSSAPFSVGNSWRGNSMHSNGLLAINLRPSGENVNSVTANDDLDRDDGPNLLQNFPILASATRAPIGGSLNSTPNTTVTIDFYANSSCDPTGHGEGGTWLGSETVTTDAMGNATFSSGLSVTSTILTATATDPAGNSSEFSQCFQVGTPTAIRLANQAAVTSNRLVWGAMMLLLLGSLAIVWFRPKPHPTSK